MSKSGWSKSDIPSQNGKVAIVTGATAGLGYETALVLAEKGATVILLGRNETKGKTVLEKINTLVPNAKISFENADLASLASITEFCKRFLSQHQILDLLINNGGVMTGSKRQVTSDGFELHFGTNHLSHFALTAQLLPALRRSSNPRVVNVSSLLHRNAKINFEDLQLEKSFNNYNGYSQSKLFNILFTLELQKRSNEGGWGLMSIACHPGYSRTDINANGFGGEVDWISRISKYAIAPFFSQTAAEGALPTLFAATSLDAEAGGYYGPNGFYEMKGTPAPAYRTNDAKDPVLAKKLWDVSVSLSNVTWP